MSSLMLMKQVFERLKALGVVRQQYYIATLDIISIKLIYMFIFVDFQKI